MPKYEPEQAKANRDFTDIGPKNSERHQGRIIKDDMPGATNYGAPSADHERPSAQPGERDPLGVPPGRRSPFSK